jgi:hypothetical protein
VLTEVPALLRGGNGRSVEGAYRKS